MQNSNNLFYLRFVEQLLFLDSVEQVRYTLHNTADLNVLALYAALGHLGNTYQQANKTAQFALVQFLQGIVDKEFAQPQINEALLQISDVQDFVDLASKNISLIRTYILVRDHRDLLNVDVYDEIRHQQFAKNNGKPSPHGLMMLNLVARFIGDKKRIVESTLLWASYCRNRYLYRNAFHHLQRIKSLVGEQIDKDLQTSLHGFEASMLEEMGDNTRAAEIIAQLLKSAQESGDSLIAFRLGDKLAGLYRTLGRYTEALELMESCAHQAEELGMSVYASKISNLQGLLLDDLHRYEEAEVAFEKSLNFARSAGDQQLEFVALNNTAANFLKRGNNREGLRRFQRIARLIEKQGNLVRIAASRNNLGHALLRANQPKAAWHEYLAAWEIKSMAGDKFGEAIAALGLGDASRKLGKVDDAEMFYHLALIPGLELYRSTGDSSILRNYALSMAATKQSAPDAGLAQTLIDHREIARQQGDVLWELLLIPPICKYLAAQGERAKAIELYRDAIERAKKLDNRSPQALHVQVELASFLMEDSQDVLEAYRLLSDVLSDIDVQMRGVLLDERRSQIIDQWIAAYSKIIQLLLEKGEIVGLSKDMTTAELAFNHHEAAKSRTFIADLADATIIAPADIPSELRTQEGQLLELERILQKPGQEEVKSVTTLERLTQVRRELQICWAAMQPYAPEYVRLRSAEPVTLKKLHEILSDFPTPKMAFVSFFCDSDSTTAFVVRSDKGSLEIFRSPVGREKLDLVAQRLRRTFNGDANEFPPYPPIRREQPETRRLDFLEELSQDLLRFLPAVEGVELLCIAPHGPLHLLPLHALRMPDGKYLMEQFAVCYTPSASTLSYVLSRRPVSYPHQPAQAYIAGIASLDDTRPEYFENDSPIFDGKNWHTQIDSGPQAVTPDKVMRQLQENYDVVHLTCHGYFDSQTPLKSGLLLSDGISRPPRDPQAINVFVRRGFLLTANDLLRSEIHVSLVTLRACSTGVQKARNFGDEFEGLSRALLYAGSSAILVSLWNVDQQSSQHLLSRFYRNWIEQGLTQKWKALWNAQKDFLLEHQEPFLKHPYHWAPFIIIGDWR